MGCSSVSRTSPPAGSGEPSSNSGAGWLASSTTTSTPTSIQRLGALWYVEREARCRNHGLAVDAPRQPVGQLARQVIDQAAVVHACGLHAGAQRLREGRPCGCS